MKRLFCIIAVLLIFSGCTPQKAPETAFWVDEIKNIEAFEGLEKFDRYYPGYTAKLIPSYDYGELIPYIGKVLVSSGDWPMTSERFGLCTTDGKIVVDPVFEYCNLMKAGDETYYNLTYAKSISEIETAQEKEDFNSMYSNKSVLARTDGSFCMELGRNWANAYTLSDGKGRIAVADYGNEMDSDGMDFKVYDEKMNLLYTLNGVYNYPDFSKEIIDVMVSDGNWNVAYCFYVDKLGNKVIDGERFAEISPFKNGLASVKDRESGLYGYIDTNGDYVIQPQFKYADGFGKLGYANVETDEGFFIIDVHGNRPLGDRVFQGAYLMEDGRVYNAGSSVRKYIDVTTGDYLKCPLCGKHAGESKMNMSYLDNAIVYIHTNCDGKTGVFSADGKVKEHIDYTNISGEYYIERMDDRYVIIRDTTADTGVIMYDRKTKEVKTSPQNNAYYSHTLSDGKYVMMSYEDTSDGYETGYYIYENGEKTDREFERFVTSDGEYFSVVSNGFSYVYDKKFKEIMKISISDND